MSARPVINRPEPDFYWTRLVKGGPKVPARIWRPCCCTVNGGDEQVEHDWKDTCDRYPPMRCTVAGFDRDPVEEWPSLAGRTIPESEFRYLTDCMEWDRQHAPTAPLANPRQSISLGDMPSLF